MTTRLANRFVLAALLSLASGAAVWAQAKPDTSPPPPGSASDTRAKMDNALKKEGQWYFSWGYSRQQYAPTDIHVSQPSQGNDFTVHQAAASDFATDLPTTVQSIFNLDLTTPQENVRIGKFMNPEKTFAIEFSLDHSKYNTDIGQVAPVTGTINNQPYNANMVLNTQNFFYALHNGLNHIMINGVWLRHLQGPEQQAGDLQLISRLGAGILLPHADNTILGNQNQVGPKNDNICCFKSNDWWQLNGWTAGGEIGLRYRVWKQTYLEFTTKLAYGQLHGVPVYQGTADQKIWMSEQVLSAGFLF